MQLACISRRASECCGSNSRFGPTPPVPRIRERVLNSSLILLIAVFLVSCGEDAKEPEIPYPEGATVLPVKGMYCNGCKVKVMRALSNVEGVDWAQIEVELGEVAYSGNAGRPEIVASIREAGYEVVE